MTGDEFVGVGVLLTFVLALVVSGILAAMPSRPRARSWGPKARPVRREWVPGPLTAAAHEPRMISYAPPRVEVVDAAACEYCGRRAEFQAAPGVHRYRLGAATCAGCGAPAPAVVLQMAPPDPRALVNRVIR